MCTAGVREIAENPEFRVGNFMVNSINLLALDPWDMGVLCILGLAPCGLSLA